MDDVKNLCSIVVNHEPFPVSREMEINPGNPSVIVPIPGYL